jgi:hypothetical protein
MGERKSRRRASRRQQRRTARQQRRKRQARRRREPRSVRGTTGRERRIARPRTVVLLASFAILAVIAAITMIATLFGDGGRAAPAGSTESTRRVDLARVAEIEWQRVPIGDLWFEAPSDWEVALETKDGGRRLDVSAAPALAEFMAEHAEEGPIVRASGIRVILFPVGDTSSMPPPEITALMDKYTRRSFRYCGFPPAVMLRPGDSFGTVRRVRRYDCNNGLEVVQTIAMEIDPHALAVIVRLVGTPEEMDYLLGMLDSVPPSPTGDSDALG